LANTDSLLLYFIRFNGFHNGKVSHSPTVGFFVRRTFGFYLTIAVLLARVIVMHALIIDTSYLMYRSYFAYPNLTSKDGSPAGAFFGFAKTVMALLDEYQPDQLIFTTDTPKPTWRHVLLDSYKAGRPPLEESMRQQIPVIQKWISLITPNVYTREGFEADDLIYTLTAKHVLPNYGTETIDAHQIDTDMQRVVAHGVQSSADARRVSIFSSDKDLYQLFTFDQVRFIKTQKGSKKPILYTREMFEKEYDLEPAQWLDYKALVGDSSDNLKGISGVGPKTATKILHTYGSLHKLYSAFGMEDLDVFQRSAFAGEGISADMVAAQLQATWFARWKDALQDQFESVMKTYCLAGLSFVPQLSQPTQELSLTAGIELFEQFGFRSLVRTLQPKILEESDGDALF